MFYSNKTLAYYKSHSFFSSRSIRELPARKTALAMQSYLINFSINTPDSVHPEDEAVMFYALNHGYTLITQKYHEHEQLSEGALDLVQLYFKQSALIYKRAIFYVLGICLAESRHSKKTDDFNKMIFDTFGESLEKYTKNISSQSRSYTRELFFKETPDVPLGVLADYLVFVFKNGKYSGGFGGKAWAKIAQTFQSVVNGGISPEIFCDTVFTLAHNNGNIFNKNFLYHPASQSNLNMVLDVQRSGQIPQLLTVTYGHAHNYCIPVLLGIPEYIRDKIYNPLIFLFPELKVGVDWKKVQELGALGNYSSAIAKQYPQSEKKSASWETYEEPVKKDESKYIWITPKEYVTAIKREEII